MYKWLAILGAILVALWVQSSLKPDVTVLGFILLFGLAGVLWLAGAPPPADAAPTIGPAAPYGQGAGWLPIAMTSLATLAAGGAVMRLWPHQGDPLGLWLWGAAVACLVIGWWRHGAPSQQGKAPLRFSQIAQSIIRWEVLLLLVILLGAFLVRWHQIDVYPNGMQSDESNNARDALKWLGGAPYTPYSEANEGQATLFTYLIALCFRWFGVSINSMRLAAVISGVLTVASFYVLVRTFTRPPIALFTTALLAVSRWHLTFSRIAYELILTPFALIWLFFFLYRGMRNGRGRDFVCAGLALALGFNTYTAFRVAPLGVALLCLFWLVQNWRRFWPNLGKLALFTYSGLVGLTPLLLYTLQNPQITMIRTVHISIFNEIKDRGSWEPLWFNLQKYAFMFNVVGDNSSLNNLPGEPMLDTLVAALFILGLVYALWHWRNLKMFLLLTWCLAVLPAGILTVTVETPSARRVIGLLPALYLFAAVVCDAFWQATETVWRGQLRRQMMALALMVAVVVAFVDVRFFFNVQAKDASVVRAFNIIETSVGRYLAKLDANNLQVLLDPAYVNNGIVDFIAQNKRYSELDVGQQIPFLESQDKAILYVLAPSNALLHPVLQYFYPTGVWQDQKDNLGDVVFHTFLLSREQQVQLHGVTATYSSGNHTSPTNVTRDEAQIGHIASPIPPPFHGEWRGALQVKTFGQYEFEVTDSSIFTLTIDNAIILSQTHPLATGITPTATLALPAGFHNLRLETALSSEPTASLPRFWWGNPNQMVEASPETLFKLNAPTFGLIGTYYPNKDWQDSPKAVQQDLIVTANHTLPDPYSVIWRGKLWAPQDGNYVFGVDSDDGAFLYIDGKLVVDNGGAHGARYVENALSLTAGLHPIEVHYFQDGGSQELQLFWTPPGGDHQPIPVQTLLPYDVDVKHLAETVGFVADNAVMTATASLVQSAVQPVTVDETNALILKDAHGPFLQPRSVAVSADGHTYIIDTGNRRLVGLSPNRDFLFEQSAGSAAFQDLADVAVDATGQVYVLDAGAGQIEQFTPDGKHQQLVKLPMEAAAHARGLFALGNGEIWLANTSGAQVLKLTPNEGVLQEIPLPGMQPVDVLVGPAGNIFVTESEKHHLLLLSPAGSVQQKQSIGVANTVDSPHLAQDRAGNIFLTDPEGARILKLAPNGTLMQQWHLTPTAGELPVKPIGIAIDPQDRIWVADVIGNRIWVVTQ
ncbi:MAG: PA14 domain-containing protein [Caldilineaceae bacterium]